VAGATVAVPWASGRAALAGFVAVDSDCVAALIVIAAATLTTALGAYGYTRLTNAGAALVIGTMLILSVPLRRVLRRRQVKIGDTGLAAGSVGYGVLANKGMKHDPVVMLKVISAEGKDITQAPPGGQQVVDAGSTSIINDVLRGYDKEWGLGFDRPLAAKSGTTNIGANTGDGWLMSYNPDVVIAAWAGHTSNDPTVGNATRNFFGVNLAQPVVDVFLKAMPGRWKTDFTKPSGVGTANCGSGGLSVPASPIIAIACSSPLRSISARTGRTPRSGAKNRSSVRAAITSEEPVVSMTTSTTRARLLRSRMKENAAAKART